MPITKKKPTRLPEIRPNVGIERAYYKEIMRILLEIQKEVHEALIKEFKKSAKQEKMAMDGIADWEAHVIEYLKAKWEKAINKAAPNIANQFVNRTLSNYETMFRHHMRKVGFTVQFQVTPYQLEVMQATMQYNVSLIQSIASQYLERVEGRVWACITQGYDLSSLSKNLRTDFNISKRIADFIARDQASKAHAVIERAKREEFGITKAIWQHSHAGKTPRPSHVAANGKEFNVSKGMYLDGKWTHPGEEINCRCCSRSVIEGIK